MSAQMAGKKYISEYPDANGHYPLMKAARANDVGRVADCIAAGHDINRQDRAGFTAVMHSVVAGHEEAALMLMYHDADLSKLRRLNGQTALHIAMGKQMHQVLERWLQKKGPLDVQETDTGRTALMVAISKGDTYASERLILAGADFDRLTDKEGHTAEYAALRSFEGEDRGFILRAMAEKREERARARLANRAAVVKAASKLDGDIAAPPRAEFRKKPKPPAA